PADTPVISLSRKMRQTSTVASKPGMNFGDHTMPKSNDLPFSGPSGNPASAEPDPSVLTCECVATAALTNDPSVGTPTHAGFATVMWSQGSLPSVVPPNPIPAKMSRSWEP